jgi:hypothetical protein
MINPRHKDRTYSLSLAILAASFIGWLLLLIAVWLLLTRSGVSVDFWPMAATLSTALGSVAILSALFVAYRELNEATNSRYLEVGDRLFEELIAPEIVEARRRIYQQLPETAAPALEELSEDSRAAAKRVLDSLDRIAFLTQAGWIPHELVMPWMAAMVDKTWSKLEPIVTAERARRNEPDYYAEVDRLADECRTWRRTHVPAARITWLEDAL